MPGHAYQVPQIQKLEQLERLRSHVIQFYINLQALARAMEMRESRLPMKTQSEDAARDADGWLRRLKRGCVGAPILFDQLRQRRRPIKSVRICLVTARLDLRKFLLTLKILVDWIKR